MILSVIKHVMGMNKIYSLEEVLDIFIEKFESDRAAVPADTLSFTSFDLSISYQPPENAERTSFHSSVPVACRRKELLEKAVKAASCYINYSIFKHHKGSSKAKHSNCGKVPYIEKALNYRQRNLMNDIRIFSDHYHNLYSSYLSLLNKHIKDPHVRHHNSDLQNILRSADVMFKHARKTISESFEKHLIYVGERQLLLNNATKYLDPAPSNCVYPKDCITERSEAMKVLGNIIDKISNRLESFGISPNEQETGKNRATEFKISVGGKNCIQESIIYYYLLEKALNVVKSDLCSQYNNTMEFCNSKFQDSASKIEEVENPLSIDQKIAEFNKIKDLCLKVKGNKTINQTANPSVKQTIDQYEKKTENKDGEDPERYLDNHLGIIRLILENLAEWESALENRWDIEKVNDKNSPYETFANLVGKMFESLNESSYTISGANGVKANLEKRPKVILEFKAQSLDTNPENTKVSFDFTFSHPHMAGKEIKITDCHVSNDLRLYILDKKFLLNSNTYNEVMGHGFVSSTVRSSYTEMIGQIFRDTTLLFAILEGVCTGIISKDGSEVLEDYAKFIPLYLCTQLMKETIGVTINTPFDYKKPALSKPVIVFKKKDGRRDLALGGHLSSCRNWMYNLLKRLCEGNKFA